MLFINIFKYIITIARVVKVIALYEYQSSWHEYELIDYFRHLLPDYDKYNKSLGYGNHYREIERYTSDYKLLIEYSNRNIIYQIIFFLNNSSNYLTENSYTMNEIILTLFIYYNTITIQLSKVIVYKYLKNGTYSSIIQQTYAYYLEKPWFSS